MKLTENDCKKIEDAVSKAEELNKLEIIPMILKQSDFYPAAHFRCALLFALATPMIIYQLPISIENPVIYIWSQLPALFIGYLLPYKSKIKRFFSTRSELKEEVHQKAIESFFIHNIHQTKERTGILIFISLLEHKIEILTDIAVKEKFSKQELKKIIKSISYNLKKKNLIEAIVSGINECGELGRRYFPLNKEEENKNELSDKVLT